MKKNMLIMITLFGFLSCKPIKDLPTVDLVDINKYAGTWYEIARLPNKFEKDLECVTATYTIKENGKIEVLNKGKRSSGNGDFKTIKGTAWVPDANYQGRLKVRFFWPFAGDYYIISLSDSYDVALVGDPSRKFLWVLSKNKVLDNAIYSELLSIAKVQGFDIDKVMKVNQDCE